MTPSLPAYAVYAHENDVGLFTGQNDNKLVIQLLLSHQTNQSICLIISNSMHVYNSKLGLRLTSVKWQGEQDLLHKINLQITATKTNLTFRIKQEIL